jgi:peptidyl-prolyl cis-trans isomerase SDCCAG10
MSKLASFMEKIKDDKKQTAANRKFGGSPAELAEDNGELKGYGGKVDANIDHRSYLPAAWRVDEYLEPSETTGGVDPEEVEEEVEDDLATLRGHRLVFAETRERDALARKDDVNDYIVHDPLLEKGKAKFNRQQQRERKRETEWAGKSRD